MADEVKKTNKEEKKTEEKKEEEKQLPKLSAAEFRAYSSMAENMQYYVSPPPSSPLPYTSQSKEKQPKKKK